MISWPPPAFIFADNEQKIRGQVAWSARVASPNPATFVFTKLNEGCREQLAVEAFERRVAETRAELSRQAAATASPVLVAAEAATVTPIAEAGADREKVEPNIWRRQTRAGDVFEVAYKDAGRSLREKCDTLEEARARRADLVADGKIGRKRDRAPMEREAA